MSRFKQALASNTTEEKTADKPIKSGASLRYKATKYTIVDPSGIRVPVMGSVKIPRLTEYLDFQLKAGLIVQSDD